MRKALALAALAVLFGFIAVPLAAAETALGTSKWSLELGTHLGTGSTNGSFAVRRHSGATSAFRLRVDVSADGQDGEGTRTDTGNPDTETAISQGSSSHALSIQWMRFAAIRDNVTATFAVGPILRKQRSYGRQEVGIGLPTFSGFEYLQDETAFGLDLGLGVEWFFNRRISLGGQSGLLATTGKMNAVTISRGGTGPTYSKDEIDYDLDSHRISTATTRIQLTAYF